MTEKMDRFIDAVDELCFKYKMEIWPTDKINYRDESGQYPRFFVHDIATGEKVSLIYIDGDGRGE